MPSKQEGESVYIKNGQVLRGADAINAKAAESAKREAQEVKSQPLVPGSFTTTTTTYSTQTSTSYSQNKSSNISGGAPKGWWTSNSTPPINVTGQLNVNSNEPYLKAKTGYNPDALRSYYANTGSTPSISSVRSSPIPQSPVNLPKAPADRQTPVNRPRPVQNRKESVSQPESEQMQIPKTPIETSVVMGSLVLKIAGITVTNMNVDNDEENESFDVYITGDATYLGKGVETKLNITSPSLNFDIPFLEDQTGIISWDQHGNSTQMTKMSSDDVSIEVEIEIEKIPAECENCVYDNGSNYEYDPWNNGSYPEYPHEDFSWMDQYRPDIPENFSNTKVVPSSPTRRANKDQENELAAKKESSKPAELKESKNNQPRTPTKTPVKPASPTPSSKSSSSIDQAKNANKPKLSIDKELIASKISPTSSTSLISEPKVNSPLPKDVKEKTAKELSVEEKILKMRNKINDRIKELTLQKKLQDEEAQRQAERLEKLKAPQIVAAPAPIPNPNDKANEETKIVRCKNHPPHITCMNCLNNNNGKDVKKLTGNIYGFN